MTAGANGLTYREYRPASTVIGTLECLWRRERWRPPDVGLGVLPDGRIDLIWADDGLLVVGPQTRSLSRPLPADVVVVGARFPPGVGPSAFGVPAHELTDRHVELESIDTRAAAAFRRRLSAIEGTDDAPARIAHAAARQMDEAGPVDLVVRRAVAMLDRPRTRVSRLAGALAISERQLERRFLETVGYGPKVLHRVLRFQRFLGALTSEPTRADGLARIAGAVGYADQAHLSREVSALSGHTPAELARALRALEVAGASGVFKTGRPRRKMSDSFKTGTASGREHGCRCDGS